MIVLIGILIPILTGLLLPTLKLNKLSRNVYVVHYLVLIKYLQSDLR